jgi:lysyl-tRNA synthetase, class II
MIFSFLNLSFGLSRPSGYPIGITFSGITVLNKMGHVTTDALKNLSAGKLFNDLCGFNKKNKLGLPNPSMEDVKKWVEGQ